MTLLVQPDLPVARLWRPGYPLRPRCSGFRRVAMLLLLAVLGGVIGSYMVLTDPQRVRIAAEEYLTNLLGGPVSVGRASLSIFDGLTLADVVIRTSDAKTPDAILLKADAFTMELDPAALLHGRLAASRLVVSGPHVRLVENVDTGTWNYQQLVHTLRRRGQGKRAPATPTAPPPQIVLRDAEVQYSEIRGSRFAKRGTIAVEGRLWPSPDGARYSFELQSISGDRTNVLGAADDPLDGDTLVTSADSTVAGGGPVLSGQVGLADGQIDATLSNLRFGRDIEAMLPSEVRDWWAAHQIEGRLNIPAFHYSPPTATHPLQFSIETRLDHVQLLVPFVELINGSAASSWSGRQRLLEAMAGDGANLAGTVDAFELLTTPASIAVSDVSGTYRFSEQGITLEHIQGRINQDLLSVNGHCDGYTPDAPVHLRIASAAGQPFVVQEHLPMENSLPPGALKIYDMIRPHGIGSMWLEVDRTTPGAPPQVTGEIHVDDGGFACKFYPYPVTHAHGVIAFVHDDSNGMDRVEFRGIQGFGLPGGPNAASTVSLNGWVGPFDKRVGCAIHVVANNMTGEPALFESLPRPVAAAEAAVWAADPAHPGVVAQPALHGAVRCDVTMPIGLNTKPAVAVDLDLDDVSGRLAAFSYPLRHLRGRLAVRSDHLDLTDVAMTTPAGATLAATVHASWHANDDLTIADSQSQVRLAVGNMPIDGDLLAALSPDQQAWLKQAGVSGRIDVDGTAGGSSLAAGPATMPTTGVAAPATPAMDYDLHLQLHDGRLAPPGKLMVVDNVTGKLHLTPSQLSIEELAGRRGEASVAASGSVDFSAAAPVIALKASATNLPLDPALHESMPAPARESWDALQPRGSIDAYLEYAGNVPALFVSATSSSPAEATALAATAPAPGAVLAGYSAADAAGASTTPSSNRYTLTLRPRGLALQPRVVPYPLEDCTGAVVVTPDAIRLERVAASHGAARFTADGVGQDNGRSDWDLTLGATDVPIDADLRGALPPAVGAWIDRSHLHGTLGVQLSRFHYQGAPTDAAGKTPAAALAVRGSVRVDGGRFDIGVPVENVTGSATGDALLVGGRLEVLQSHLDLDQMDLAGRAIRNLSAEVSKPGGDPSLHLDQINGELAGGRFAGTVTAVLPMGQTSASQSTAPLPTYALDVVLKNADVGAIAGPGQELRGQLSASLAMEGQWNDVSTRRGRGDVVVTGESLYQIPLLLGLWDVTNLALPATSPFNEATARYNIDGKRVTFEQVTMRSDAMVMSGNGFLDFGSKQVRMNFGTDNANWPKLPFIHDLVQGAKSELLRIQIRGTVQEPKVSAAPLHTFTTTVDQVLGGSGDEK
jgi:hypothetical protein